MRRVVDAGAVRAGEPLELARAHGEVEVIHGEARAEAARQSVRDDGVAGAVHAPPPVTRAARPGDLVSPPPSARAGCEARRLHFAQVPGALPSRASSRRASG